ncbi:GNAT family protein, partial [Pseudomonas alcaligenes]|uniref:GNAT family N-acetyltransferase n=1 Tax=Pseudomonas sp. RIT-PI-AD TaxID=3035294 RepID=UPI0021DA89D3
MGRLTAPATGNATRDDPDRLTGFGGIRVRDFHGESIDNPGYHFSLEAWGRGYATDFAGVRSPSASARPEGSARLDRLTALVRENHLASQRVLEKVGFQRHARSGDPDNPPPLLVYRLTRAMWD